VDVDVPRRLSNTYALLAHPAGRLDLKLSTETSPLHRAPPKGKESKMRIHGEYGCTHSSFDRSCAGANAASQSR
jgi:hypothetical protein